MKKYTLCYSIKCRYYSSTDLDSCAKESLFWLDEIPCHRHQFVFWSLVVRLGGIRALPHQGKGCILSNYLIRNFMVLCSCKGVIFGLYINGVHLLYRTKTLHIMGLRPLKINQTYILSCILRLLRLVIVRSCLTNKTKDDEQL